jgi:hypothetical protein
MCHLISLATAEQMTARYRNNRETILASGYKDQNILAISETYGKDDFEDLINTDGCASVRIYYGMDENLKVHAIVVAVNANNEDILPESNVNNLEEDPIIIDNGIRCPELCGAPSPLNPE